jgi:serine/threonine protein kinase
VKLYHLEPSKTEKKTVSCYPDNSDSALKAFIEYPGKKTLKNFLDFKSTPFRESALWTIIYQVINACAELEKINLFHGDLRPDNMFVSKRGVQLCVKAIFSLSS